MFRAASTAPVLGVVVLAHLILSMLHGVAHTQARVPLSPAANLFVYIVIVAGPLVGLALLWPARRTGAWVIAATLAASFVFGVVNHFVLNSPDHVAHVAAAWRPLFASTAVLIALLEALGVFLAARVLVER